MSNHSDNSDDNHPNSRSPAPARRIRRDSASPVMAERIPLILANEKKPPLASSETDDEFDDDGEAVSAPYPGVDDGFFNGDADKPKEENPGSENLPKHDSDDVPVIMSRAGPDGGSEKPDGGSEKPDSGSKKADGGSEEPDGGSEKSDEAYRIMTAGVVPSNYPGRLFPYPTYGHDIETGSVIPDLDLIPDVNVYQHKKTVAQGMMDLALFSANANQLRYVLESFNRHPYFYPSVAVGIGLIWNSTYNVKNEKEMCIANKISNFTIIAIFLVTVINVFISAFGVANPPPTTGST
ncbi:ninjurin-A-like isoform X2 [Tenebrio molitor]|uniref:ninjurin-A-like isoform X2 n=1 Tax=Tenebrio molitor TaxID=7067 RepID=UPI003624750F